MKKTFLKTIPWVVALVIAVLILNANLLFPWQWNAQKNKQAILEYVHQNYPDAKIIQAHYDYGFNPWNKTNDYITFEWDDIEFGVSAEGGKIVGDGYPGARAINQFDTIIKEGFMKPRGIETACTNYSFLDNYKKSYPYTGGLVVRITVVEQGSTPREVGWLYDFYKYWRNEGNFLTGYRVQIEIVKNNDVICHCNYINKDEFSDESEFYGAFKAGPMM